MKYYRCLRYKSKCFKKMNFIIEHKFYGFSFHPLIFASAFWHSLFCLCSNYIFEYLRLVSTTFFYSEVSVAVFHLIFAISCQPYSFHLLFDIISCQILSWNFNIFVFSCFWICYSKVYSKLPCFPFTRKVFFCC